MSSKEVAARILALRSITRETGFITKRSQNELLLKLNDEQLQEVALEIRMMENENEPAKSSR
jgi:hypothetical protein